MIEELNKIIDNIENGVVTPDGNIRPYDILDYYQNEYIIQNNRVVARDRIDVPIEK